MKATLNQEWSQDKDVKEDTQSNDDDEDDDGELGDFSNFMDVDLEELDEEIIDVKKFTKILQCVNLYKA